MPLPSDTREFIRRWRDKRDSYGLQRLEDCFDRFFTSYVLYNFLYELVAQQEGYALHKDQESAVKAARRFLDAKILFEDEILRKESKRLLDLIEKRTFYIRGFPWDVERIAKLKSNDPEQWSKGLLEVVYGIRNNTFHGQKQFVPRQRLILVPCIRVLEHLNDKLIERLERPVSIR